MENPIFRYSTPADADAVDSLIRMSFGDRSHRGVTDNLDGRYLLAVADGTVVGMSGICDPDNEYCGLEVDWTCVHPDYRKQGIVTSLLDELLARTSESGYKGHIYYSAWRTWDRPGKERMDGILTKLGFHRAVDNEFNWVNGHNCRYSCKEQCVHYQKGCSCGQDLWVYEMPCYEDIDAERSI